MAGDLQLRAERAFGVRSLSLPPCVKLEMNLSQSRVYAEVIERPSGCGFQKQAAFHSMSPKRWFLMAVTLGELIPGP